MDTTDGVERTDAEVARLYPHAMRTVPYPLGAERRTATRFRAYCVCGGWVSDLIVIGVGDPDSKFAVFEQHQAHAAVAEE